PAPVTELGQFKAVLINGGGKPALNFQSHLTHVRSLVAFLESSGVPAEDITIFSGDGSDPAADLATRSAEQVPNAWLLPTRLAHVLRPIRLVDSTVDGFALRPATTAALRDWFAGEGQTLGP